MSTFQTLISIVLLIFVLSVLVQALQEFVKAVLGTKANVMRQTLEQFMRQYLTLPQIQGALDARGFNITALEHFNRNDFRSLLDGITLDSTRLQGLVSSATASLDQIKDNIASAYEAARASFQQAYTRKNKLYVLVLSLLVVLALNANLIILYEQISADQATQQALVGEAAVFHPAQPGQGDLGTLYEHTRQQFVTALQENPILIRTRLYPNDFQDHPMAEVPGLLLMGILVSLGAPFWNDILKSLMGINSAFSTAGRRSP